MSTGTFPDQEKVPASMTKGAKDIVLVDRQGDHETRALEEQTDGPRQFRSAAGEALKCSLPNVQAPGDIKTGSIRSIAQSI